MNTFKIVESVVNILASLGLVILAATYYFLPKVMHAKHFTVAAAAFSGFCFMMYKVYSMSIFGELKRASHKIANSMEALSMYKFLPKTLKMLIKNNMQLYLPKPYRKIQHHIDSSCYFKGRGKIILIAERSKGDRFEIVEDLGTTYVFTTLKLLDRYVQKPELISQMLLYKLINTAPRKVGLFIFVLFFFASSAILIHYTWIDVLQKFVLIPDLIIMLVLVRLISEEQRNFYIEKDKIAYKIIGKHQWRNFVRRTSGYNFLLGPYV